MFKKLIFSDLFGGILLMSCVVLSLIIANTPLASSFNAFLHLHLGFENSMIDLNYELKQWIDDGLMAVFFLLVGLEIKREIVKGQLSSPKNAALPIFAAVGGAIIPALIYILFNQGTATHHGWGIPMATDIAFALAVIKLLGNKVPSSLKVFLAALAIVDDLLAILVIAIFYSGELHMSYLFYAAITIGVLIILNKLRVLNLWFYLIPGVLVWYFIHHSGIHATIAGVLVAMTIPLTKGDHSPLERLEHTLTRPVNLLIIPIFALANTNITLHSSMMEGLTSSLGLGIMCGLIVGKTVGITLTCWICVKSKLALLPSLSTWKHIIGVALLAGIGFTMSIFIAMLSFSEINYVEEAKLAILIASLIAGISGYNYLKMVGKNKTYD